MDSSQNIHLRHPEISRLIERSTLRDAIIAVESSMAATAPSFLSELQDIERTYMYMLHYLAEGYEDESRRGLIASLRERLHRLNDMVEIDKAKPESSLDWFASMRMSEVRKESLSELAESYRMLLFRPESYGPVPSAEQENTVSLRREWESLLGDIFVAVWVKYHLSKEDASELKQLLISDDTDAFLKTLIASALVLGSLHCYDERKLDILADIADGCGGNVLFDDGLRGIAMTGVALVLASYPVRGAASGDLRSRIELWRDDERLSKDMRLVVREIIRTIDTDRARKKMNEEVIPELMKLRPDIMKRMRDVSIDSDVNAMEENPEWADMLEKTGLRSKLEDLSEMQSEGADLMMAAFANLKDFSFFRKTSNWFMPFYANHSEIRSFRSFSGSAIGVLFDSAVMMCDSDKYSFALSLERMQPSYRDAMTANLSSQFEQMRSENAAVAPTSSDAEVSQSARKFIRNLYRYFKLFGGADKTKDCFASPVDLTEVPLLWDVVKNDEFTYIVGEFYFSRKLYTEALSLLPLADDDSGKRIKEKIGYCYQQLKMYDRAYSVYQEALLVNPESKWLMRRLAQCSRHTGRFAEAAVLYGRLLESDPDNGVLLMHRANSLYASGDIEAALKVYYKINYLQPDNQNADRAIAWCEFLSGNHEKSRERYARLLLTSPNAADYLNAGHLALAETRIKEAAGCYKEYIRLGGIEEFDKAMKEDIKVLVQHGVDSGFLDLLRDKLLYDLD